MYQARGFSLLETMIALVIMQVGLLALCKSQLYAWQALEAARDYNVATRYVVNITETLQVNPSESEILKVWEVGVSRDLPQGHLQLDRRELHTMINIHWGLAEHTHTLRWEF